MLPDRPQLATTRRHLLGITAGALAAPAVLRAAPAGSGLQVAVIGAGVFGAWMPSSCGAPGTGSR